MSVKFNPAAMQRREQVPLDSSFLTAFTNPVTASEGAVQDIAIDLIDDWADANGHGQPFYLYPDAKLEDMAENIRENGILNPCIVRPTPNGRYQMIAGHNRKAAARMAGLTVIPCMVKDLDDDTATLYMVDSNLYQREHILPSERATAYALKLDIYRKQGKRTDLTGEVDYTSAADRVAEEAGESARSVQRYARLTKLSSELLQLVDDGNIPVTVGAEVAGLKKEDQRCLWLTMQETGKEKLTMAQMNEINDYLEQNQELTMEAAENILTNKVAKAAKEKMQKISIPQGDIPPAVWKEIKKNPDLQERLYQTVLNYAKPILEQLKQEK